MGAVKQKKILEIALSKVVHHNGRVWYGELVPCEVIALVKAGARSTDTRDKKGWDVIWAEERAKKGSSCLMCFYFTMNKNLQKLVGERNKSAQH